MSSNDKYNGWSNYETWCVHLWLTNEESSYLYWREEARRHRSEAANCPNVIERVWTIELAQRAGLAEQLRSEIEDASPLDEASMLSDLLNAALSEVDWQEIAEAFLEELEPVTSDDSSEDSEAATSNESDESNALLFPLGHVVVTKELAVMLTTEEIHTALTRHSMGDWGDLSEHDKKENGRSLKSGRLLSVYLTEVDGGEKARFYVITEADRSVTTLLLPNEY
jgi:hypothetical protein